jgi:hypothetical protein
MLRSEHLPRLFDDVQGDAKQVGSLLSRQIASGCNLTHGVERVDASRMVVAGCLGARNRTELIPLVVAAVLQDKDRSASNACLRRTRLASRDVRVRDLLVIDVGHDGQVLNAVVEFVVVDVVDNLRRQQCPSEVRRHHEAMLKDVPVLLAVGMAVRLHLPVSASRDDYTTIPTRVPVGKVAMAGQPSRVRFARHCPSKCIRPDTPFQRLATSALTQHSAPPMRDNSTTLGATKMAGGNP